LSKEEAKNKAINLLKEVGIKDAEKDLIIILINFQEE
jgi:hypothetical protein